MYADLSIVQKKDLEISHLLRKLPEDHVNVVCVDYVFHDEVLPKVNPISKLEIENVHIYTRATLCVGQTATLHQLGQDQDVFDVLAVRPLNEKIFHALCTEYENYDVISLDIENKLPFMLKRNPVYEAIRKGKYFEIQYCGMFEDSTRVVCMTNISNIIKATNGKNVIVSSGVSEYGLHRTPYDVASLLISLGMNKSNALTCMKENCLRVIQNGQHRRFFKGTVQQITVEKVEKISKRIAKHRNRLKEIQKKKQKKQMQQN